MVVVSSSSNVQFRVSDYFFIFLGLGHIFNWDIKNILKMNHYIYSVLKVTNLITANTSFYKKEGQISTTDILCRDNFRHNQYFALKWIS